ncbi:MAG: hypothetical protein HDR88_07755 [Bacteroides sp.]|nr:hypothetical protein [Bacteroides sp.]
MENLYKKDMIEAALRFRAAKLWEVLDDSMIFAVRLPDGKTGYCCVMGNAGEHYAIALYKGSVGFTTYLNSITNKALMNPFEIFMTYECINCDFENATDSGLNTHQKALIKEVAKENNLKICRPKGYPTVIRHNRGIMITDVDQSDAESITCALKAGLEVASKIKNIPTSELNTLGFGKPHTYPPVKGGKKIPFLIPQDDGTYQWSLTKTPALGKDTYLRPKYSNIMTIGRLKSIDHKGEYQVKLFHMPATVKCAGGSYYPMMMILVNKADGMLVPIMSQSEQPHDYEDLLNQLAFTFLNMDGCPQSIEICDPMTESFLSDFCSKVNIELVKVSQLPIVDHAITILGTSLGFGF